MSSSEAFAGRWFRVDAQGNATIRVAVGRTFAREVSRRCDRYRLATREAARAALVLALPDTDPPDPPPVAPGALYAFAVARWLDGGGPPLRPLADPASDPDGTAEIGGRLVPTWRGSFSRPRTITQVRVPLAPNRAVAYARRAEELCAAAREQGDDLRLWRTGGLPAVWFNRLVREALDLLPEAVKSLRIIEPGHALRSDAQLTDRP